MRYYTLGKTDIRVSAVGAGTWAMGGDFWGAVDEKLCIESLHASLDHGVNLIDTAPVYGKGVSETTVGKALKGRRHEVVLATKCGLVASGHCLKRDSLFEEVEISLKRLGTDYIDLYQMHWPDPDTEVEESMQALLDLKKQGKIRAIGVSNFDTALMDRCLRVGQLDSLQPPFSMLDRAAGEVLLPYCKKNSIGVLSYGSLGAGMLTGKFKTPPVAEGDNRTRFYKFFSEPLFSQALRLVDVLKAIADEHNKPVAHVAINWVSQQPGMTCALVGSKNPAQAIQNAAAGEWELSAEEMQRIDTALVEIYGK